MKKVALLFAALLAYAGIAFAAVNINSATKEQLESLDGVGPVKAQAIIDYRTKNGPFKSLDDVMKVDGIKGATFEKMRKDISLTGTTVPVKTSDQAKAKVDDAKAATAKTADKVEKKTKEVAADTKAATKEAVADTKAATKKTADKVEAKTKEVAADTKAAAKKTEDKVEKKVDDAKAAADKKAADKKAADEKKAADKKATADKKAADKKAANDKKAAADKK